MGERLRNKVAIVTGAASGIGRATAVRFAQEGARVVVADRNQPAAEETVELIRGAGGEALLALVDVSKEEQVRRMVRQTVERFGGLDVLVNAAAILIRTPPLTEVTEHEWDLIMETNLKGTFLCCKYAIPAMLQRGGGAIVNISSGAGMRGYAISFPYAVSKAGIIHLTTNAAFQYTPQGIRINCVVPGPVDTPQMRGSTASAEAFHQRELGHPMGRVGRPEELANAILFLASDEASFVSGTTFIVDGGAQAAAR